MPRPSVLDISDQMGTIWGMYGLLEKNHLNTLLTKEAQPHSVDVN